MKSIKILCFKTSDNCEVISPDQSIQLNNIEDKNFLLQIDNQGDRDCELNLTARNQQNEQILREVELLISNDKTIIFQDNLEKFFTDKINLDLIKSKSEKDYFFALDLTNLASIKQILTVKFDLFLDFNCSDVQKVKVLVQASPTNSQGSVLAAHSLEEPMKTNQTNLPLLVFLLSSLFVVVFFVIIKIVHGKKKTKKG